MIELVLWAHGGVSAPALFLFAIAAIVCLPIAVVASRGLGAVLQRAKLGFLVPTSPLRFFVGVWVTLTMVAVAVLVNVLGL